MARQDHGLPLSTPTLKAGSTRFVLAESGFDTGARTLLVDAEYLDRLIPVLETPDTKLRWKGNGGVDFTGRFGTMYVSSASIGEERNGICEVSVNFLGLIRREKRTLETVQTQTTPFAANVGPTLSRFAYATPVVNRTYISATKPDTTKTGGYLVPPGWSEAPPVQLFSGNELVEIPGSHSFNWILRQRDYRKAGNETDGYLYEVTDQHVYEPLIING